MSNPNDYTIGWICAIRTEYVAARAFLDEEHKGPGVVSPNDNNAYTLGKIGEHNVVIAVLPDGQYGISTASNVARDMMHSFPNIRFGLMVGIGGGAPSKKHDIRLGDIVVSAPRGGKGGVFQYDFGKTIQDQSFRPTGFLNQPPSVLLTAVTVISGQYESDGHRLEEDINDILRKKPRLRNKYSRPDPSSDRLYQSEVVHPADSDSSCVSACGADLSKLILRPERTQDEDNPTIHYGVVASGNQLMKDASVRDKVAAEENILCFEMEAAGLMNHFPCLIIRGICDYSDSHKNKEWQGYAAMVAAAYAKDLLRRIAPTRVEAEKKFGDILSGLQEVAEEHRDVSKEHCDIAKEQLQTQKDLAKERLSEEKQQCHQLFRLTTSSRDATYEWYKDRVEERVEGTCMWFLKHEHFQMWLNQESGPLLVTADPGCGKSVLAKYLIDHGLPRSTTICYFFFKDQDQNTVRQALCALLHQLFSLKPSLIEHAMPQFREDGQGLINSTESLWKILRNAINDPRAGPAIMVLDALDECAESEFTDLMRNIESQFRSDQLGYGKLKYLLTCRPYDQIVSKFRVLLDAFPNIHIPGEEESGTISQEVNRVITHRINQLSMKKRLLPQIKSYLEKRLQETTHRTYLWVYLVFDYLEKDDFKKTLKGVESAVATLPRSINEAYEQILNKTNEDPMVRKALSIILAASRPLTLSEMNVAVNIDYTSQSIHDLDLEDDEDFKTRLRSWCGLFVSIHQGNIYFIHQTAREFLLADLALPTAVSSALHWHHSIMIQEAHAVLAELCVLYLNYFNSNVSLPTDANGEAGHSFDRYTFLKYSAQTWGTHFREARVADGAAIIPFALKICDPDSKSYSAWFRIYWQTTGMATTADFTDLMIASYYGHHVVVKLLLEKGPKIEAKDSQDGRTPLLWAAEEGHEAVVKLLIENGANVDAKDVKGRTSLSYVAEEGHEATVKLLLERGADVNAQGAECGTALQAASHEGHETIVQLLLERGADDINEALQAASSGGHEIIVQLMLDRGADVNAQGGHYNTALQAAALRDHETIVQLLLERGADVNAQGGHYHTALQAASHEGHETIVQLLLERGADVNAQGGKCGTALQAASSGGHETIVQLLLERGADVNAQSLWLGTALQAASSEGHVAIVQLLLERGADDINEALQAASSGGNKAIVQLLLERGANADAQGEECGTALQAASLWGHVAIVRLLLERDADVNAQGGHYNTALQEASHEGHETIVQLLLERGADDINEALQAASSGGHETIVQLMLDRGADVNAQGGHYHTALQAASHEGHETIVQLLLERGADVDAQGGECGTALQAAS